MKIVVEMPSENPLFLFTSSVSGALFTDHLFKEQMKPNSLLAAFKRIANFNHWNESNFRKKYIKGIIPLNV